MMAFRYPTPIFDTTFFDEVESVDGEKTVLCDVVAFSSKGVLFRTRDEYWVLSNGRWKRVPPAVCERLDFSDWGLTHMDCNRYPNNIKFATTKRGKHIVFLRDHSLLCLDLDAADLSVLSPLPPDTKLMQYSSPYEGFSISDDERYVTFSEPQSVKYEYESDGLRVVDLEQRRSAYFPALGECRLSQFAEKGHALAFTGRKYWRERMEWEDGGWGWSNDDINAILDIDSMSIVRELDSRKKVRETDPYANIQWNNVFPLKNGGFLCRKNQCLRVYTPTGRLKSDIQLPEGFPSIHRFMQLSADERVLFCACGHQYGPPWVFIDIEDKKACVLVNDAQNFSDSDIENIPMQFIVGFSYGSLYESKKDNLEYHIDFTHWGRDYGPIYYDGALIFRNNDHANLWSRVDVSDIHRYMVPLDGSAANDATQSAGAWSTW
ncbi:hypothetical protein [Bifidobacterium criceti]|nr:hypothetical protein [Bifidobacterium criceti]